MEFNSGKCKLKSMQVSALEKIYFIPSLEDEKEKEPKPRNSIKRENPKKNQL
jgi:hypothetical protein